MICTYECTFCRGCVDDVLDDVCPNCGGGFSPRPIRPRNEWRTGLSLTLQPPSTQRHQLSYDLDDINVLVSQLRQVAPVDR